MVKSNAMRRSLTIDEGTLDLIKETQKIIHYRKKVDFDLKDIIHIAFSNPEKIIDLIEKNIG